MQQGAAGGQCTFSNKTFCACNNNLDNRDPIFRGTDEFLIILIFADNKCHHLGAREVHFAEYSVSVRKVVRLTTDRMTPYRLL